MNKRVSFHELAEFELNSYDKRRFLRSERKQKELGRSVATAYSQGL